MVDRHPGAADSLARRKVALTARAADPLGWALAKLGEAVAQIGHLQEISSGPLTPERSMEIGTALAALTDRLASAHTHLNSAASNLHQDADRLITSAPGAQRAPTPPAAERNRPPAALPVPPTASKRSW
ncbi:hypothetical protein AB0H82_34630 [Streptomyces sp. NPDC050732]|uniref:hypothetical protein n=1 Tax=Streptomyces sp. NPDC050732 TaxID=3154632 RepID=UPI003420C158